MKPKQIRFAQEYIIDLNATQAALRAGYSPKSAYQQAHALLKNVEIQKLIKDCQQALSDRTEITAEKVLQELADVGFANMQDYIADGNLILNLKRIKRKTASAVESIKVTETIMSDGSKRTITQFKLHDKVNALTQVARHLGMYEKDNEQGKLPPIEHITNVIIENPHNKG